MEKKRFKKVIESGEVCIGHLIIISFLFLFSFIMGIIHSSLPLMFLSGTSFSFSVWCMIEFGSRKVYWEEIK